MFFVVGLASAQQQLFSTGMLPVQAPGPAAVPILVPEIQVQAPYQDTAAPYSSYSLAGAALVGAGVAAVAFSRAGAPAMSEVEPDPLDVMELAGPQVSRRSVVAALPLAALAAPAFADVQSARDYGWRPPSAESQAAESAALNATTEDSIAAIARKNAEKLALEKERKRAKFQPSDADLAKANEEKKSLILGIAGAGTLASGLFILPNLQRLATKITSGGQDSGYGTAKDRAFRANKVQAKPKPKAKPKAVAKRGKVVPTGKTAPKKSGFSLFG